MFEFDEAAGAAIWASLDALAASTEEDDEEEDEDLWPEDESLDYGEDDVGLGEWSDDYEEPESDWFQTDEGDEDW